MPLTTIDKCKRYLKIDLNDKLDDDFLTDIINSTQNFIETYCHRKFDLNTYTAEQHNIMHKIFPKNTPVKSVDTIKRVNTSFLDEMPSAFEITNYRLFPGYIQLMDYMYLTIGNKLRYANNRESYVEVTYTAGYTQNEINAQLSDLSLAATKLVAIEYKDSREDRLNIEQEREGDVQYTYSKKDTEMPLNISSVLDKYKKVLV